MQWHAWKNVIFCQLLSRYFFLPNYGVKICILGTNIIYFILIHSHAKNKLKLKLLYFKTPTCGFSWRQKARRRDTLIGSAIMNSFLHSLLAPAPPSIPSWYCWCWVAPKALTLFWLGLQQPRPRLTCFNNFLLSSVKLCKYFSPVSFESGTPIRSVCLGFVTAVGGLQTIRPHAGDEGLPVSRPGPRYNIHRRPWCA